LVCSRRGHIVPAASVATLRPEDAGVGVDLPDGRRFARCLRCDCWLVVPRPLSPSSETLPPLSRIILPRRGEELREAIVVRIIAIDRIVHVVLFGALFALALELRLNIGPLHDVAQRFLDALNGVACQLHPGCIPWLPRDGAAADRRPARGALDVLIVTSLAYAVLELVEAIGLWHERRWAEYLTVVATSGLLPFEILELSRRVTVFRVGALIVNLLIVIWLVYRKRLCGVGGGRAALARDRPDPEELLAPPVASAGVSSGA
jgi:Predicted membrane protein